jgi:diguanylate cyclase (GGDEF)-like protein
LVLLQLVLLIGFISYGFSHYLQAVAEQQVKIISHFVSHNISSDPKRLARQLSNSYDFKTLKISHLDGTKLYQHESKTQPQKSLRFSFGQKLLNSIDGLPSPQTVLNQSLNTRLDFELSFEPQIRLLDDLIQAIILITIFSALIQQLLGKRILSNLMKVMLSQVGDQIHKLSTKLPVLFDAHPNNQADEFQSDFPPLTKSLTELEQAIIQQLTQMQHNAEQNKNTSTLDELTGLPNRNRFVEFFEQSHHASDGFSFGCLGIIRCSQLQELNQSRGYQYGDNYVKSVVQIIENELNAYHEPSLYRLNGTDFAVLIPNIVLVDAQQLATNLQLKFSQYQRLVDIDSVAYTGLVRYHNGNTLGELLALADTAISIAQTQQTNGWYAQQNSHESDSESISYGNQSWREVIEEVISNQSVTLLQQIIEPCERNNKAYSEILTRFTNDKGQTLPTTSLFAMAEKLDLIHSIEQMIIDKIFTTLANEPDNEQFYAINLTAKSAHDSHFLGWLERQLQHHQQLCPRLVFEISEYGSLQNVQASKRFIAMVHRLGARITVERFGVGLTSFKFFRDLKPDHIKMDGSYTRNIDEDKNNQYFMRLIVDLAHRIDVKVFAETIETANEKQTLENLQIDGTQGFHIHKPQPF